MADLTGREPMKHPVVVALVDGSAYGASVAEHGAFLAGRAGASLRLLHAREPQETPAQARRLLEDLGAALVDQGAPAPDLELFEGEVAAAAMTARADLLVMGKRGASDVPERLGNNVAPAIAALDTPLCLVSKIYLPIHRVLAVTDADPAKRAVLDLVANHPGFAEVELDLVVVSASQEAAEDKLGIARRALDGRARAFAIHAERLGEAVWRYLAERPADLIVISRAVLLSSGETDLRQVRSGGLWSARASVLVC